VSCCPEVEPGACDLQLQVSIHDTVNRHSSNKAPSAMRALMRRLYGDSSSVLTSSPSLMATLQLLATRSSPVLSARTGFVRLRLHLGPIQVLGMVKMLYMKEADWGACGSTLEGHSSLVSAVAFSPDGQLVV
jgi:WD40 repeat protein